MGVRICPECNGKVSDKLHICKHCGYPMDGQMTAMGLIECKDCGCLVSKLAKECPDCGCPIDIVAEKGEDSYFINRCNIPSTINREYDTLMSLVDSKDIYGAIFKLRDVFEIIMKIPTIMSLIVICNNFDKKTASEENAKKYKEILAAMLSGPLAMGSWQNLMAVIKKNGSVFCLGMSLENILEQTNKCLNQRINSYTSVAQWRNETVGHGTLMINKSDEYWQEIHTLINILNKYFKGGFGKKKLNELYENVYIEINGIKLCGNDFVQLGSDNRVLVNEGKKYKFNQFIYLSKNQCFYFDSFYSAKRRTKITDYVSHSKFLEHDMFYTELYALYEAMVVETGSIKFSEKYTTQREQMLFECLNDTVNYEEPKYILDELRKKTNNLEKGIIILQMERGMGKSAFAHALNGAYQSEYINQELNAIIRTYHLSEVKFKGVGHFYISPINCFLTSANNNGNLLYPDDDKFSQYYDNLTKRVKIAESFAGIMEIFRETYIDLTDSDDDLKLIYMIDGIDELGKESSEIIKNLPCADELSRGCYIVLTSRFDDEEDITGKTKEIIQEALQRCENSSSVIKIRSNNELYIQTLRKYIERLSQKIPSLLKKYTREDFDSIINHAQNKFLYVRPYMEIGEDIFYEKASFSAKDMAEKYLKKISEKYYGRLQETFEMVVCSVALLGKMSLEELGSNVLSDGITYDVIGCINDLMPLLTVKRENGKSIYEYANEEYSEYILNSFPMALEKVIEYIKIAFEVWIKTLKNDVYYYKEIEFYMNAIERIFLYEREKIGDIRSVEEQYLHSLDDLLDKVSESINGSFYKARITYILINSYENLLSKKEKPSYFNPIRFAKTPEHYDWDQVVMYSPWERLRTQIKYALIRDESLLKDWISILICPVYYSLFTEQIEQTSNPFYDDYANDGDDNKTEREIVDFFIEYGKQDILLSYLIEAIHNDLLNKPDYYCNSRPKRTSRMIYLLRLIEKGNLDEKSMLECFALLLGVCKQLINEEDLIFLRGFKRYGYIIERLVEECNVYNYDYKHKCPIDVENIEKYIPKNYCRSILDSIRHLANEYEYYNSDLGMNMYRFENAVECTNALYNEYFEVLKEIKKHIWQSFVERVNRKQYEQALLVLPNIQGLVTFSVFQGIVDISILHDFFENEHCEEKVAEITILLEAMSDLAENIGSNFISNKKNFEILDNFCWFYKELLNYFNKMCIDEDVAYHEDSLSRAEVVYAKYCEGCYEGKRLFLDFDPSDIDNPFLYVTSRYGMKCMYSLIGDASAEWRRSIDLTHDKLSITDYFVNSQGKRSSYFIFYLQYLSSRINENSTMIDFGAESNDYLENEEIQKMANSLVVEVRSYVQNAITNIDEIFEDNKVSSAIVCIIEELVEMQMNPNSSSTKIVKDEINNTIGSLVFSIDTAIKEEKNDIILSWLQYIKDLLTKKSFTYGFFDYDKNEEETFSFFNHDFLKREYVDSRTLLSSIFDD